VRQPETPSLPPGTDGIRIQFAPAPALAAGRLVIFGACALAADSAVQLNDTLLDNGWSFTTQNIIVIASRGWYDTAYPEAKKKAIVIHEAGHKIGARAQWRRLAGGAVNAGQGPRSRGDQVPLQRPRVHHVVDYRVSEERLVRGLWEVGPQGGSLRADAAGLQKVLLKELPSCRLVVQFLVLGASLAACTAANVPASRPPEKGTSPMPASPPRLPDEAFAAVDPGSGNRSACSPTLDANFIGIVINAPEKVVYTPGTREPLSGAFARFMICGTYRLDAWPLDQLGGFREGAKLVATDAGNHDVFADKMVPPHPTDPQPNPPHRTAQDFAGQTELGYFNENLLDRCPTTRSRTRPSWWRPSTSRPRNERAPGFAAIAEKGSSARDFRLLSCRDDSYTLRSYVVPARSHGR
jgi:hypothetical protein